MIKLFVNAAVVVAALASASIASAHEQILIPAPRTLGPDDALDWEADLVSVNLVTDQTEATITTTVPDDVNFLYSVELLLFCSDGSTESILANTNVLSEGTSGTLACQNDSTIEIADLTIYVYK